MGGASSCVLIDSVVVVAIVGDIACVAVELAAVVEHMKELHFEHLELLVFLVNLSTLFLNLVIFSDSAGT